MDIYRSPEKNIKKVNKEIYIFERVEVFLSKQPNKIMYNNVYIKSEKQIVFSKMKVFI